MPGPGQTVESTSREGTAGTAAHDPGTWPEPDRPEIDRDPPSTFLAPDDALKTLRLPPGYRAELVAHEPMVVDPISVAWDGNGRMFAVEMRGFMLDVDGKDEKAPIGRVVRLEDVDGDGKMDRHTVFLDGLVEPRAVMTLGRDVVVAEPPNLWFCRDMNDDGVADAKVPFYREYSERETGNVEHKGNSLTWAIDNWVYSAGIDRRFRLIAGRGVSGYALDAGQWGLSQDDSGHLYYSRNEMPYSGGQIHPQYVAANKRTRLAGEQVDVPAYDDRFMRVWPIVATPDVQAGPAALREDGTLERFTSIGGQAVYRGDALPDELSGDLFLPDPVGRLVRRAVVDRDGGVRRLRNPYEGSIGEFLASTDLNFRPVSAYTGPDGALYVVDMYRGIIQHHYWMGKGSYLRDVILERGLDKNVGRGRIYRIVHEDAAPVRPPRLLALGLPELVQHLGHPNGWRRDTAQQLLVLGRDKSVVPALREVVASGTSALGRVHALWTLEGLESLDVATWRRGLADDDPRVRQAAIRAGEVLLAGEESAPILDALAPIAADADLEVVRQLILTVGGEGSSRSLEIIAEAARRKLGDEIIALATMVSVPGREVDLLERIVEAPMLASAAEEGTPEDRLRKRWLNGLAASVFHGGEPAEIERLFGFIAAAPDPAKVELLRGLALAASTPGATPVELTGEPAALAKLRGSGNEAVLEQLASSTDRLHWEGKSDGPDLAGILAFDDATKARFARGNAIYVRQCANCHGKRGEGVGGGEVALAPPLAGARDLELDGKLSILVMLHGLKGPVDGRKYAGNVMAPVSMMDDEWIAAVLTYVRNEWGNAGGAVSPEEVAQLRRATAGRDDPWTQAELLAGLQAEADPAKTR